MKKCPFCGEEIQSEAKKCKRCWERIESDNVDWRVHIINKVAKSVRNSNSNEELTIESKPTREDLLKKGEEKRKFLKTSNKVLRWLWALLIVSNNTNKNKSPQWEFDSLVWTIVILVFFLVIRWLYVRWRYKWAIIDQEKIKKWEI